jgi:hypothetical protein
LTQAYKSLFTNMTSVSFPAVTMLRISLCVFFVCIYFFFLVARFVNILFEVTSQIALISNQNRWARTTELIIPFFLTFLFASNHSFSFLYRLNCVTFLLQFYSFSVSDLCPFPVGLITYSSTISCGWKESCV